MSKQLQIRLDWSSAQQAQPLHSNQLIAQVGSPGPDGMPDGVLITFGSAPAPVLMQGTDIQGEIERLASDGVKVNVLGQFHITRQMLDDLLRVLQETAQKFDTAARQAQGGRGGAGAAPEAGGSGGTVIKGEPS